MKIKKFNQILENRNVDEYIADFEGSVDHDNILYWIEQVTPFEEYKNFTNDNYKKPLRFAKNKKLKNLEKWLIKSKELDKLYKELDKLNHQVDELHRLASGEVLYTFQEDLLNKDFDNFYDIFIKDSLENGYEEYEYEEMVFWEIHPNIEEKYKDRILDRVKIKNDTDKYNL
jgi:hypothetical protein